MAWKNSDICGWHWFLASKLFRNVHFSLQVKFHEVNLNLCRGNSQSNFLNTRLFSMKTFFVPCLHEHFGYREMNFQCHAFTARPRARAEVVAVLRSTRKHVRSNNLYATHLTRSGPNKGHRVYQYYAYCNYVKSLLIYVIFQKWRSFIFCNQRIFVRQEQLSQIAYGISERGNISSRERRNITRLKLIVLFQTSITLKNVTTRRIRISVLFNWYRINPMSKPREVAAVETSSFERFCEISAHTGLQFCTR